MKENFIRSISFEHLRVQTSDLAMFGEFSEVNAHTYPTGSNSIYDSNTWVKPCPVTLNILMQSGFFHKNCSSSSVFKKHIEKHRLMEAERFYRLPFTTTYLSIIAGVFKGKDVVNLLAMVDSFWQQDKIFYKGETSERE